MTATLLTFALTWTAWLGSAALAGPGGTGFFGMRGPVFLLGVFAPAIVGLVLTARHDGRAGVARLLSRVVHWDVGARCYLFAVGYMPAIKLAAALVHRVATGAWPPIGESNVALMLGAIAISTWVQAGEELGWRGYALPRLATRIGLGGASIVLGVIWALWHLPLFFLPGTDTVSQSFPIYLLGVTALSVAMAWLYWRTGGSLLLVMLMHASVNNTSGIVPSAVPGATDALSLEGSLVGWVTSALAWAVAVPCLVQMGRGEPHPVTRGSPSAQPQWRA